MQADILHRCPDDCQATGLRREDVDLISSLPHEAPETLNGIGRLNMSMHALRELVKREGLLFFLRQTSHGFWIALAIFGFEGGQLGHCLLFIRLIPDANKFGLDISTLPPGDGIQDIALFMQQTTLTRGGREEFLDCCQQSVMTIAHNQINLGGSSCAKVLKQASPPLFVLFCTGSSCQNLFVSCQIHASCCQNDRGISRVPVTNAEMHPI